MLNFFNFGKIYFIFRFKFLYVQEIFLVECKSVVLLLVQDDFGGVIVLVWLIVQYFLFGLIGVVVDISNIQLNMVGMCDLDYIFFEKVFLIVNLLILLKI